MIWVAVLVLAAQARSPLDKLDRKAADEVVGVLGESVPYKDATNHITIRVAFSPAGTVMGVTTDKTVQLWNFGESPARKIAAVPLSGYGEAWAFSPDGKTLAAAGDESAVRLWDLSAAPPRERGSLRPPARGTIARDVAFAPDGKTLAVGHHDGTVRVWDLAGKIHSELKGHTNYLTRVAFSPDGRTLASGSRDKTVKLWDMTAAEPRERASLGGHLDNLTVASFSPDGKALVSSGTESVLRIWDPAGKEQRVLKGHKDYPNAVRGAAFLAGGRLLASAAADGQVILWDVAGGRKIREWQLPGKIHGMVLTPDGRHLAVVAETTLVYILRFPV